MRYVILMSLFLMGCDSSFRVSREVVDEQCIQKVQYHCTENNGGFHTLAICDTKEECIQLCDKYRNEYHERNK